MRPAISFTREIDPFRMAKFIPHKVQITAVDGGGRDQTDHFMQSYTPFHHKIVIIFLHMPIHVGIDKTENDRLVTHQRLVMTFRITNCTFLFPAKSEAKRS